MLNFTWICVSLTKWTIIIYSLIIYIILWNISMPWLKNKFCFDLLFSGFISPTSHCRFTCWKYQLLLYFSIFLCSKFYKMCLMSFVLFGKYRRDRDFEYYFQSGWWLKGWSQSEIYWQVPDCTGYSWRTSNDTPRCKDRKHNSKLSRKMLRTFGAGRRMNPSILPGLKCLFVRGLAGPYQDRKSDACMHVCNAVKFHEFEWMIFFLMKFFEGM